MKVESLAGRRGRMASCGLATQRHWFFESPVVALVTPAVLAAGLFLTRLRLSPFAN
jgi:hypothetical protein